MIMTVLKEGARRLRARLLSTPLMRRFARRQDGATAVEFGLVAAPFLAVLFAIIETALVFFAGQTLETAVSDSARLIMTGEAQTKGFDQNKFREAVCGRIFALFDCQTGLEIDVKTYTAFSNIDMSSPIDANGNVIKNFSYQPGGPGDIVVVRLLYRYPVYVSLMGFGLSNLSGGAQRLLVATAAFRNEPYQ